MEKYIIVKKIGEGSFGKAILVRSKENGDQFVVKEIGISKMKPKERNEARKEVTVLSKMRHPNIVQYTESFEENGHLYIVMEYCEGGDLYALINKQKGVLFPERQVLSWFVQLCLALKHVHDRKILHRDIKTSNIFLTKSGAIKLGDFGIARVLNNTMELARTCIGTPYYLSPEICENKPYNNKSDVWALGCVAYEILTLKHAFEAGNMKNLVLKIIRGSYPPVPSRYSYDLRTLVSHLFRRNPRERPSINSILRKPLLANLTEQFLSPEQHEEEFSHTVLHKGRGRASKPSSAGRYQPVAAKRPSIEVRGAPLGVRQRRDQQVAAAYGPSIAVKKPKPAARPSRVAHAQRAVDDLLEKKRQLIMEEEKRKKDKLVEEKKKRLEDLQKRQRERAQRIKDEQMKRAREEARILNLKRSADLLDVKDDASLFAFKSPHPVANAGRDRPVSAPKARGEYEKYHQYLNKLEQGDRAGAANFAAPGLDKVKEAWEDRNKKQAAIAAAQANKVAGEQAADRARVVNEYLQRKQEALFNKRKGNPNNNNLPVWNQKVGVAAALQPYAAAPSRDVGAEQQYLARLQQIRQQNYMERRALHNKFQNFKNQYKVVSDDAGANEESRKNKIAALQQQAADRAKMLKENMDKRRANLDGKADMKKHEAKARARGIIPPDERIVKYNPNPIGITQALHAVGASIVQEQEPESHQPPDEELVSPSKAANPHLRKKILQRVNERYSVDFDEEKSDDEKKDVVKDKPSEVSSSKPAPRPLPVLPTKEKVKPKKEAHWKAWSVESNIGKKLAELPLQETASQMEATNMPSLNPEKPAVAKRQWGIPSDTFVQKLNQMTLHAPTMTLPPDKESASDIKDSVIVEESSSDDAEAKEKSSLASSETSRDVSLPVDSSPSASRSFDNKTVVLRKIPTVDPPSTEKETPASQSEHHLAANAKPLNKLGTYVIKSPETDILVAEIHESAERNEKLPSPTPGSSVELNATPRQSISDAKDEVSSKEVTPETPAPDFKTGNTVQNEDPADNIEEIELKNESKTEVKLTTSSHDAWSKVDQKDKLVSPKPAILPKPSLPPKPKLLSAATPTKAPPPSGDVKTQLTPEKDTTCATSNAKPESSTPSAETKPVLKPTVSESPFFKKVNKFNLEGAATSPVPKNVKSEETDKRSPLSRSLYKTANDQMLMKITLGHFDSPDPKLLRTCSLPDLNDAGEDESKMPVHSLDVGDDFREISMASMNDTNFDDIEAPFEDANDDATVATDEEEMDDLRANLESVLLTADDPESSSPPFSKKSTSLSVQIADEEDESNDESGASINEGWQSDSESFSDSNGSEPGRDSDTESVFCRLEHNREELERELGMDKFLKAYRSVQAIHEDEDEGVRECEAHVRAVLGDRHDSLYPRILQLVMADGAYCEDND